MTEFVRRPAGFTGDPSDLPGPDEMGDDPIGPLVATGWSRERRDLFAEEARADRDMEF